ncbi:hypothetical protein CANTEDRAFT_91559 [Yamadazyma tenuis ATCC 10573]|uniref:Sensitive to high expression protein 9, mitochondrial n=1 Tax=Candida tenuis (strain ATCC 10573 / BCRC 21748 / CBS 615 / JCM 9827 / NBRC 10315 / NRRL Y-1498 / VKM Y-70) TaxID=590646 RepID=G3AXJ2_CANTC|nr:uncharacterized protein CANTEDRAFT_91559 [Yamadazyma tenuis ATCC 10573]EGV66398.1 hypothetical protein CANTEDRAFT_91559 [Yamadazyma tenuis ATCC 10573]
MFGLRAFKCTKHVIGDRASFSAVRWQSSKSTPGNIDFYTIRDPKLRDIIESSSFGSEKTRPLDSNSQSTTQSKKPAPLKSSPLISNTKYDNTSTSSTQAENRATSYETFTTKIKQDIMEKVDKLPSQKEELTMNITKSFKKYMDRLHPTVLQATKTLNDVTGYSAIEQLRLTIDHLENDLKAAKEKVKEAKSNYMAAIQERSLSQKEVNELLTRKHTWSSEDLERFTQLYRNDHVNEQNEASAHEELNKAEQMVDSVQLKLTQSILTRYHEEQIWSDKIRQASTWGTWILMGFNVLLFFTATLVVEPWKRRKMVDSFDIKVKSAILEFSQEQRGKMDTILTNQAQNSKVFEDTSKSGEPYSIRLPFHTWATFKQACISNYKALTSPLTTTLIFDKTDFGLFVSLVSIFSCTIASLLTIYFH